jgi:hypothetical protein
VQERVSGGVRSVTEVPVDIGRTIQDVLRSEIRLAHSEGWEWLQSIFAGCLLSLPKQTISLGAA